MTTADETDCEGVNGGAAGNLCHVDCSNRGLCNYEAGLCECFDGFTSATRRTRAAYRRPFPSALPGPAQAPTAARRTPSL